MKSLAVLNLHGNELTSVPDSLAGLDRLQLPAFGGALA